MSPEQLAAENQRLKGQLHDEEARWRNSIEEKLNIVMSNCIICKDIKTKVNDTHGTVYGDDKAGTSGLKGAVGKLKVKMGMIQWVTCVILVAVAGSTADRFINRPMSCEGLEAATKAAVKEAADIAAEHAAQAAAKALAKARDEKDNTK